ncbi:MAG: hypothetical protein ACYTAO_11550, partial [Planctomycetota bacterium]
MSEDSLSPRLFDLDGYGFDERISDGLRVAHAYNVTGLADKKKTPEGIAERMTHEKRNASD